MPTQFPIQLTLPWPPRGLSPNARVHWAVAAKLKAKYRDACVWTAVQQGARKCKCDRLHLALTFCPPSKRKYDLDNALASIKSGLDGLADVLGVDDSRWSLSISKGEAVVGVVRVTVTEQA